MRVVVALLCAIAAHAASINFEEQIAPILVTNCLSCHGGGKVLGSLRLTTQVGAYKAIVPGSPEKSRLYLTMEIPTGQPGAMPPSGQLPKADRDLIRDWIKGGATWPSGVTLEGMKLPSAQRAS